MIPSPVKPRDQIFVKSYGFFSFARNIRKILVYITKKV